MQTPNERTVHCNWSQSKPWGNMDNRIFDKFERNFTNYTGILTCSSYDTVLDGIIRPCIIRPPFRPSTNSNVSREEILIVIFPIWGCTCMCHTASFQLSECSYSYLVPWRASSQI